MPKREMEVSVLADGTVTVKTGDMSGEHHMAADQFLKELAKLLGGPVETKSTKGHIHSHQHGEVRHTH